MYPYPPQQPQHTQWQPQQPPQWQPQPPKPSHFRLGNGFALIGGLVAGASFFLPFISFFGFNINLLTLATVQQNPPVQNQIIYFFPPLVAIFLVGCSAITLIENTPWLNFFTVVAGVVGLFTLGLILFQFTSSSSSSSSSLNSITAITNYLSAGFYGCAGGFLLGCIGGIIDMFR